MALLEVKNVKKTYVTKLGGNKVKALEDVTFSVEKGEYVAIMGESGSGKTTLLNILATLDQATCGEVLLDGENLKNMKQRRLATFRRDNLGFVFQDFNLLDIFILEENICLPLVLQGKKPGEMKEQVRNLAKRLGMEEILKKYPYEVSGGQKQRAAAARALITNPKIILADEPTGALDSKSAAKLLQVFKKIHEEGQTILMVTHSVQTASHAKRVLFIKDGSVFHQIYKGDGDFDHMYRMVFDTMTLLQIGGEEEK